MEELSEEEEYKIQLSTPAIVAIMGIVFLVTAVSESNPDIFWWAIHYSTDASYVMFWLLLSVICFFISIKLYIGVRRRKP